MPYSLNWMAISSPPVPWTTGYGILAAGEEARLLAVLRNQVRFGEALEEALVLERLDRGAEVVLGVEEEQVEEVAEHELALFVPAGAAN